MIPHECNFYLGLLKKDLLELFELQVSKLVEPHWTPHKETINCQKSCRATCEDIKSDALTRVRVSLPVEAVDVECVLHEDHQPAIVFLFTGVLLVVLGRKNLSSKEFQETEQFSTLSHSLIL